MAIDGTFSPGNMHNYKFARVKLHVPHAWFPTSEAGPGHPEAAEDYSVCQELGKLQYRLQTGRLGIFIILE